MSIIAVTTDLWKFNRDRTLATLDDIAKTDDPQSVLGWRPGPERAHIAWQLMHIGITEERFASIRPVAETSVTSELSDRFRGGSTPDDDIPALDEIRRVLEETRGHLLATMSQFSDDDLDMVPEMVRERGWSLGTILQVIGWHETHHQGQAHLTLNLWKASH